MINSFRNYSLLLVVFIHSHIYIIDYSKSDVPDFLLTIYNEFFGYFHPASILAAISGYLFFRDFSNDPQRWDHFLKEKYSKRIKSIAVPFIFWIVFFFVVNNAIIYFGNTYKSGLFINSAQNFSVLNLIKSFFYPELAVAKHLWYLNNMLFVFLLAPLFPFFTKNKPLFLGLLLAIMAVYWVYFDGNITQNQMIIKYRFIIFYLVGAFFALNKQYFTLFLSRKLLFSGIGILVITVLLILNNTNKDYATLYIVNSLTVPVLIFYFAFLMLQKYDMNKDTMYNRSNHFLLYIIHPMLISLICKLLLFSGLLKYNNYFISLLLVFGLSFVVVKLNTLIYNFLHKYFKTFTQNFL